jgi:hypothetical protein
MEHKVFSIYDQKAKAFANPGLDQNAGTFLRRVKDLQQNPEHPFNRHAADFTAFEIGTFEDSTGIVTMYEAKINVGELITIKEM